MVEVKFELTDLSAQVWDRLQDRLDGLTDQEYRWEPVSGCWTIRERADGAWQADRSLPGPELEPFTTIAWRLWHLIDMYGENRAPEWLHVPPVGEPIGLDDPRGAPPPTATEALALLARAHDRWEAHLALASEECLSQPIGSVGGGYGHRTRAAYVLHMLDEFVHHGAEIALLRDLWRWQQPLGSTHADQAIRGDLTLLDDLEDIGPAVAGELMTLAASYARWQLVVAMATVGVATPADGRTPLHLAAGAGELDVARVLVEHGADVSAVDPDFDATPLGWARFFGQTDVVAWFEDRTGPERLQARQRPR